MVNHEHIKNKFLHQRGLRGYIQESNPNKMTRKIHNMLENSRHNML